MNQNISVAKKRNRQHFNKLFILILLIALIAIVVFSTSKIFNEDNNPETPVSSGPVVQPDTSINIVAIGDIMSHSQNFKAAYNSTTKTYDFSSVFEQIQPYVESADIAIGNVETTFAGADRKYSGYPTFNTPEALATDLAELGIDVVTTANNHSLDKGYSGLVSTLDELDAAGIEHTGTYRSEEDQNTILMKEVNGIKVAFLSFTYGTNGIPVPSGKEYCVNLINKDFIVEQLALAKELSPDVICVNMHWGVEYTHKQNSNQEDLADFLFENGVDIILGSHPHVIQPMEKRTITLEDGTTKDGFVIYSLGNFMSGQSTAYPKTCKSLILNLKITKHGDTGKITIDSYTYVPTYMSDSDKTDSNRFKVLDVETCIADYENGGTMVTAEMYTKLVKALSEFKDIMGPEMDFTIENQPIEETN